MKLSRRVAAGALGAALLAGWLGSSCQGESATEEPSPGNPSGSPAGSPAGSPTGSPKAEDLGELPYLFVDVTESAGLAGFQQVNGALRKEFIVESIGAGVALFDYDNDGDLDVYLTNGGKLEGLQPGEEPRDALYANDGSGQFTLVPPTGGLGDRHWTNGVTLVDLNADGWQDLYLTNFGPNAMLLNDGKGGFQDVAEERGLADPDWSTGAAFIDFDRDGDLDLYVANYIAQTREEMLAERVTMEFEGLTVFRGPRGLPAAEDHFYINDGSGHFEEATQQVGITAEASYGFQVVVLDYDLDGWMDLYVANDSRTNFLWHNDQAGGFEERALQVGVAVSSFGKEQAGMGIGLGDVDGDLRTDLFVTNFSYDYCTLYRGVKDGYFVDATYRLKLAEPTLTDISWGCGFEDFDNDGDREIYVINGHIYPQIDSLSKDLSYAETNDLLEFNGKTFQVPRGGGGPGFAEKRVSRGAAVGDLDGDGDLDLMIENIDDSPNLLRNDGPSGNWIELRLVGKDKNRDAIGARVVVRHGDKRQLGLVTSSSSFLSSSQCRLHFGLGEARQLDSVQVLWPDGSEEWFATLEAGQRVELVQGTGRDREQEGD